MCQECMNRQRGGVMQSDRSTLPVVILDQERHPHSNGSQYVYLYVRYDDGLCEWLHAARVERGGC